MKTPTTANGATTAKTTYALRLTPAEWRSLLADGSFLKHPDNSYRPRRLMGVPVEIIPDHTVVLG